MRKKDENMFKMSGGGQLNFCSNLAINLNKICIRSQMLIIKRKDVSIRDE